MEVFIKREMQRKGMNNRQLAKALGVGDSYASGISRGDKNLSMNTLQAVADALGIPVWRLLTPDKGLPAVCPHCGKPIAVHLGKE